MWRHDRKLWMEECSSVQKWSTKSRLGGEKGYTPLGAGWSDA
jgi:hypothetical protein